MSGVVSTPELTSFDFDSFPSSPESWSSSESIDIPSAEYDTLPAIEMNKDMETVFRIFIENTFENDQVFRTDISHLSKEEKQFLMAEIHSSICARFKTPSPTPDPSTLFLSNFSDAALGTPVDINGLHGGHNLWATSVDLDQSYLPIDPSSYFDFDAVYTEVGSKYAEGFRKEDMGSFLQMQNFGGRPITGHLEQI